MKAWKEEPMAYQHNQSLRDKVEGIKKVAEAQSPNISNKWLSYLDDRQKVIQLLLSNRPLLDILLDVLVKEYEAELRSPRTEYTNVNWPLLQADKNGYKRAIENFINLLTIKD